eukprot:3314172-Prymnesium_polylepis.1
MHVSKLPTKGKLYKSSDNTLSGTLTEITAPYSPFDVGQPFSQYISRVVGVSSYWGNPPNAGYHPINIMGPPDCEDSGTAGRECTQNAVSHPW